MNRQFLGSGWRFPILPDSTGRLGYTEGEENIEHSLRVLLLTALALMWIAAILSALIDNIPFTVTMIPLDIDPVIDGVLNGLSWTSHPNETSTSELLAGLIAEVIGLNLNQGIANSLDAKLGSALDALGDMSSNNDQGAINKLGAFINAVEAQRDRIASVLGGRVPRVRG